MTRDIEHQKPAPGAEITEPQFDLSATSTKDPRGPQQEQELTAEQVMNRLLARGFIIDINNLTNLVENPSSLPEQVLSASDFQGAQRAQTETLLREVLGNPATVDAFMNGSHLLFNESGLGTLNGEQYLTTSHFNTLIGLDPTLSLSAAIERRQASRGVSPLTDGSSYQIPAGASPVTLNSQSAEILSALISQQAEQTVTLPDGRTVSIEYYADPGSGVEEAILTVRDSSLVLLADYRVNLVDGPPQLQDYSTTGEGRASWRGERGFFGIEAIPSTVDDDRLSEAARALQDMLAKIPR